MTGRIKVRRDRESPVCTKRGYACIVAIGLFSGVVVGVFGGCERKPIRGCEGSWRFVDQDSTRASIGDRPLAFFTDSLAKFTTYSHWYWREDRDSICANGFTFVVDTIGEMHGHRLIDIIYRNGKDDPEGSVGKAILLQSSRRRLRPLYVNFEELGNFFPETSWIVGVDAHQVLCTKTRYGGQASYYDEHFWTWDDKCDCPCELKSDYSLQEVLAPLIGREFRLSYMGGFDIDSLISWSLVEFPGDDRRHPSGGLAWVKLRIVGCKLEVIGKEYDPTGTRVLFAPRPRRLPERSGVVR
jgi:hypothetical protein